ncbi:MAG TPA: hypothetical protein VG797_09625 [Phycisphaerales bacterium]|nr:hypothetical protein [Phycisphaerales bacterium]
MNTRTMLTLAMCVATATAARDAAAQVQAMTRVSVATGGAQGNGRSEVPALSADGRFVAFYSDASNLVPDDTNHAGDIFIHDRQTQQTVRVSVATGGVQGNFWSQEVAHQAPNISADGRFVAFHSYASNLVPGDTNNVDDIFIHDRETTQTVRVSVASNGAQANARSRYHAMSADGRFIAFSSDASNLDPVDSNFATDVFVHDCLTGQTSLMSVTMDGAQSAGYSGENGVALSGNGRFVVFVSPAQVMIPEPANFWSQVVVHDRQSGQTSVASVVGDATTADSGSAFPAVSFDGRFIAFQSGATNFIPGDVPMDSDIFVRDRRWGTTQIISIAPGFSPGNGDSYTPVISADGSIVVFASAAANLVPGDTNNGVDVFAAYRGPSPLGCSGDADGSYDVGLSDVAFLIRHWTESRPIAPAEADLDGSGSIGLGDVAIVLQEWATVCP